MNRKLPLLLLLVHAALFSLAADIEGARNMVHRWNELHNTRDVSQFKTLYDNSVLFYGRYFSSQKCYSKKKAFLTPDFSQQIITPIDVTFYTSGIIKCSFTKEVTYKKKVKQHPCYLLLVERDGQLYVCGESDLETDGNLSVRLNLGEEIKEKSSMKGVLSTSALCALLGGGFLLYRKKKQKKVTLMDVEAAAPVHMSYQQVSDLQQKPHDALESIQKSVPEKPVQEEMKAAAKGDAFERYVLDRFKKEYFTVREWRSDKYHNGHFATSSMLPDLEIHYKSKSHDVVFAIECKWRSGMNEGKIEWAKQYQLDNYRRYMSEKRIQVFVVIGIGGTPGNPESVYIVPLQEIHTTVLSQHQLKKFNRHKKTDFFLYADRMVLE